jgi:hypothetical protein
MSTTGPGVGGLMTMQVGQFAQANDCAGVVGRDNCVEMVVPAQLGE